MSNLAISGHYAENSLAASVVKDYKISADELGQIAIADGNPVLTAQALTHAGFSQADAVIIMGEVRRQLGGGALASQNLKSGGLASFKEVQVSFGDVKPSLANVPKSQLTPDLSAKLQATKPRSESTFTSSKGATLDDGDVTFGVATSGEFQSGKVNVSQESSASVRRSSMNSVVSDMETTATVNGQSGTFVSGLTGMSTDMTKSGTETRFGVGGGYQNDNLAATGMLVHNSDGAMSVKLDYQHFVSEKVTLGVTGNLASGNSTFSFNATFTLGK